MKKQKIVIDTNLWISFLISKKLSSFLFIIESKIILLYSNQLINEIEKVVNRPKFVKYFDAESVGLIYELFENEGEKIEITSQIDTCRDLKDNFLLNLAVDGNADYLLTGDKDLLVLEIINKTKIITITDFMLNKIKVKHTNLTNNKNN